MELKKVLAFAIVSVAAASQSAVSTTWRSPSGYVLTVEGDTVPVSAKRKTRADYDEREFRVDHITLTRPGRKSKRIFTTEPGTYAKFLLWSPDGNRAYFIEQICWSASMNADGMPAYEIDLRSGRTRTLVDSHAVYGTDLMPFPRWIAHSPDSKSLAVVRGGGRWVAIDHRIEIIKREPRRTSRWLTPRSLSAIDPAWFPSGRSLAFSGQPNAGTPTVIQFGIYTIDSSGKHLKRLTTPPAGFSDELPVVSSDGRQIAFWRIGRDYAIRYRMDLTGSTLKRLEKKLGFDSNFVRRPD